MSTAAPSLRHYLTLLTRYLRPVRAMAAGMALLILLGIGLQLGLPLVMRRFIDAVQSDAAMDYLLRLGAIYLGAAVIQQVIALAAAYLAENVGWRATNALRNDLAAHLLRLDLTFHNAHTPGELIERIDGDITALANFFSRFAVQVAGNLLLMLGITVLLTTINVWIGLTVALFITITLGLLLRFRNLAVPYWKAERQASAELFGFLEERLAGAEDVRANGGKSYVMNRFYVLMRALLQRALRAAMMFNIVLNISLFMFAAGNAAAFVVGAWLFEDGLISLGTVYLVFQYTVILQRPLEEIARQMQDFQRAGAGLARVNELLDEHSALLNPAGGAATAAALSPQAALGLHFSQVCFAYPDALPHTRPVAADDDEGDAPTSPPIATPTDAPPDFAPTDCAGEPVLNEVSFDLPPGAILGLLGRTGSGKTSLTRLLFRLYDPNDGQIAFSQGEAAPLAINSLPLADLRRRIGMIPQTVQLFNASVRDNLTFFDASIPDARVHTALQDLGLSDWLAELPKGLDSVLDSGGGGLSAGQAQLLAFGRIFLRDPGLVILDEASSRLDPATESLIERAIEHLVQGRTAVIVAHRLHTVQRADYILILEAGRVLEFGRRVDLLHDPQSHFYHLLQTGIEDLLT